ncbi:type I glutamate--ammonia ligase [Brevibacillus sp. HB1.2]|uniref:type I glutamate--ammonia ligase n=1 Tax=Brevibacillus TaxID=55080 RepID=UPI00156AF0A2|nr:MULTISPECIES: type I glutamate--ammonia ligase [unclassified Brevibacillus]NRS17539.1 type I glutamate--ammonia ligase [Brevibacillus sp. HB1.4B]NTU23717.1 type I glutamate--ammonia ligase [Brevibacillus sp. HB1.2]NTU33684.1 type I glutamate--ammonia ligase [Brevibacillus sp. HB1.1]
MDMKTVLSTIDTEKVEYVDFRIVDLLGRQHHVTVPAYAVDEGTFRNGVAFDGSSLIGYKSIEESDMVAMPDPATAFIDPFVEAKTMNIICNIVNPDNTVYTRDPRGIALKAEAYLQQSGLATAAYFGPESEFFLFDNVRYASGPSGSFFHIDSEEAFWNTGKEGQNLGYKVRNKGGYFPVQPTDSQMDIRNEMCTLMTKCGMYVERHHHEVATAGQGEINFRFDTLTRTADNLLLFKYIVRNVAAKHGKTATFMPKPIVGDNGSGMHVHQSLFNGDTPLFYEQGGYANLSETALHYIGGILHHAPALIALTNPSTNSFKRLVPGYEAPVNLVFSKGNRSAAVRIPIAAVTPKASRIEFRTPDSTANPYLAFAAMLMAGLDGIKRKLDPRELGFGPLDKNIYDLSDAEKHEIKSAPGSLAEALVALEQDHDFLLEGDVFTKEVIEGWIAQKRGEIEQVERTVNPKEYELYYDL